MAARKHIPLVVGEGPVIDWKRRGPVETIQRGFHHDSRVAVRADAALRPREINPPAAVNCHGRKGIRAEGSVRRPLVEERGSRGVVRVVGGQRDHRDSFGESLPAVDGFHNVDGVGRARGHERPPSDINVPGAGINTDRRALVNRIAFAQLGRVAPGHAAIKRARKIELSPNHVIVADELGPGQIHRRRGKTLRHGRAVRAHLDRAGAGGRTSGQPHGKPRLVEELAGVARAHDPFAQILDGVAVLDDVAVLLVVQVNESRDEHYALLRVRVRRDAAVEKEPVRARTHDSVGSGGLALERRTQAERRLVLRKARQQGASPGRAAVERFEHAQPGVPGKLGRKLVGKRKVHGAVVVCSRQQVQRVARGDGDGRLVLPLEERVAARERRSGNHVDILTGRRTLRAGRRVNEGGKCQGEQQAVEAANGLSSHRDAPW